FYSSSSLLSQEFENGWNITHNLSTGEVKMAQFDPKALREQAYDCTIRSNVDSITIVQAFFDGVYDGGVSEFEGAIETISSPVESAKAVYELISNLPQTIEGVGSALASSYATAACDGKKAYLGGKITAVLGTAIIADKGARKAASLLKATRAGIWIERIAALKNGAKAALSQKVQKAASLVLSSKPVRYWTDLLDKRLAKLIENTELNEFLTDAKVQDLLAQAEIDLETTLIRDLQSTRPTLSGFVKDGAFEGELTWRYDTKYDTKLYDGVPESTLYKQPGKFDLNKMIDEGITKEGFYKLNNSVNELEAVFKKYDDLIKKYDDVEIIFVKKLNGDVIMSPRRRSLPGGGHDKLPHPYIAEGEEVLTAGTIRPGNGPNSIIINNETGHYQVHSSSLNILEEELISNGYSVIDNSKL
ncbi:MAG: hypothetical protein KDI30_07075, partial [Pseudomonadales bacterium]|nr:hypothetical protein [Pseudomonadales bacterium]